MYIDRCVYNIYIHFQRFHILLKPRLKIKKTLAETWVRPLGQEDPLKKEMATHSSTLAWKIPWMEESAGLQSMGPQRVGYN